MENTAICICGREIEWNGKWFHVHNYSTFCTGMAIDENHIDLPKARPLGELLEVQ